MIGNTNASTQVFDLASVLQQRPTSNNNSNNISANNKSNPKINNYSSNKQLNGVYNPVERT